MLLRMIGLVLNTLDGRVYLFRFVPVHTVNRYVLMLLRMIGLVVNTLDGGVSELVF
jgi:hypothetical protein